jgi:hypothetical protein
MHDAGDAVGCGCDFPECISPGTVYSVDHGVTWSDLPARRYSGIRKSTVLTVNGILCFSQSAVASASRHSRL